LDAAAKVLYQVSDYPYRIASTRNGRFWPRLLHRELGGFDDGVSA